VLTTFAELGLDILVSIITWQGSVNVSGTMGYEYRTEITAKGCILSPGKIYKSLSSSFTLLILHAN
jgi:hypothetical protein